MVDAESSDRTLEALRYPVGRLERIERPTDADRAGWIEDLAALPARLRSAVDGLDGTRLDSPYRDGGWTVRQVVHHLPDSHVNGYVRMMLALAEEGRSAALYDQERWADQPFARTGDLEPSLTLLDGLHARWTATARGLGPAEWRRSLSHPDWGEATVDDLLNLYAWHSRHHTAHILGLRTREGW